MRKIILIFTLMLSYSSFTHAGFGEEKTKIIDEAKFIAHYTLAYKEDTLNLDKPRKEEFLLFLGDHLSRFIGKTNYQIQLEWKAIKTKEENKQWFNNFAMSGVKFRFYHEFHKNYPEGKMTCYHHITAGPFLYEEDLKLFDWQLTNITDTIAGYTVHQATTYFGGRSWIAWFSPEIPFNDGPYKFNGLPGLIIKVQDTQMHYDFELNSIEKPEEPVNIEFEERNYFKTTKIRFFRAEDYARDNIVSTVKSMGNGIEAQQKVAKRMAERNNPIELKRK
jgi:GLPGLI family protein